MTFKFLFLLSAFYLTNFTSENSNMNAVVQLANSNDLGFYPIGTKKYVSEGNNRIDTLKNKIKGAWSDGSYESATFDIKDNTIFYVDHGASYPYSLTGNIITIKYPDYSYKGKITFKGDTLIMSSEEYGESKFWKFKKKRS